jgi:chromosome segregation ATPase
MALNAFCLQCAYGEINMFMQGEVEQIAMMKPKAPSEHEDGMLEFLEDIIGSSRYQEPINILAKRVEELNELRGEKVRSAFLCLALP